MADRDDAPETRPVPPPTIGSYRLVEPLGSGGMSSVFRALHKETGHEVAVKVLPRYLAKNPTLLQRFLREAKSAESLEDPNIVAIYDRGSESGRHYLVLEYVPGGDFHDRVRESGPLPIEEAVNAVRQVALGLKHAAGRGLIHRDIKPANILRRPDGVVKITDLGLALQAEDDEKVTRDGTTVGTVDYMAPEQARDSRAASLKSDIYSLGCTFYYLLTGTPPFAGGDVAEKLRAHATEPPPDVRSIRPAVPAKLAKLIQKMMAKRPEKRFADYDELIAALDVVSGRAAPAPAGPLYALIDDEEEDDDESPGEDLPLPALIDDEDDAPGGSGGGPLYALVDDDEEGFDLGPGPARASGGSTASTPTLTSRGAADRDVAGVDLSALEGMEEESEPLAEAKKPPSGATGAARPGSRLLATVPGPAPEDVFDLGPVPAPLPHLYEGGPGAGEGFDWAGWITRLTLLGVAALVIWFGWTRFSPYLFEEAPQPLAVPELEDSNRPRPPGPRPDVPVEPWAEPVDAEVAPPAEPSIPAEALARLDLSDAPREALSRDEAPRVEVRRVDPIRDREHLADLPRAFENIGGTVTIADDGPFFEEPWRMAGANRVLRASPGYRPVIVLGRPETESARRRPAAVVLDGQSLVVQGIDFVVEGAGLPTVQQSMFLLRNATLTLRDCTVTVVGPVPHDYAVVQVGDRGSAAKLAPSNVRFERTRIRGEASAVRLAGSAQVTFARSLIGCAKGPAVEIAGDARADRSIAVFRSALASRGPLIALIGAAGASDAQPPIVRAFESTFARVDGSAPPGPPLVGLVETPPGPPRPPASLVDWRGETDSFVGWEAWSSASPPGVLAGLRGAKPDAERSSREVRDPWPVATAGAWDEEPLSEAVRKSLVIPPPRVAAPAKSLHERTLGAFSAAPSDGRPEGLGEAASLDFNADDEAYNGDLGKFLAEKTPPSARSIRVNVSGSGRHAMTPVNLPDGVSLSVSVAPVPAGRPALIWTTPDGATGEALISVRNGMLALTGARLTATPKSPIPTLLAVNHGDLHLAQCVLIGPAGDESAGGRLVEFRTDGTRPFPDRDRGPKARGPLCTMASCVLMTGGDAITAEVGRGGMILENCAIASGATALVLRPEKVRRDGFRADVLLSRCTIAAMENVVRLRAWPGLPPGPDRPWVLRTAHCVFSDSFERTQTVARGVLLRTEPEGLARGVLAWESQGDVYDLTGFTVGGQITPTAVARGDIRRGWVELWGARHIENPSGYTPSGGVPAARFLARKLKPLDLEPSALLLDPNYPPGRRALDVGADLRWLGIGPPGGGPKR